MTELLGIRAYARRRGVSHAAVRKAIATGRLSRAVVREEGDSPKIDAEVADREWKLSTDPAQQRDANGQGKLFQDGRTRESRESQDGMSYARSRAYRETINAHLARLELDRERGSLVKSEEVRARAFETARRVRDRLLGIGVRLGPVVAGRSDPTECERLIMAEVDAALSELTSRED